MLPPFDAAVARRPVIVSIITARGRPTLLQASFIAAARHAFHEMIVFAIPFSAAIMFRMSFSDIRR
jgi:hypothetical protein